MENWNIKRMSGKIITAFEEYFAYDIQKIGNSQQPTLSEKLAEQLSEISDYQCGENYGLDTWSNRCIINIINEIKSEIGSSIDARDNYFKHSEIWRILRGLQLLGIKCNKISVEEMERCLNEVEKSAEWVHSIIEYDFLYHTKDGENEGNSLADYIKEYEDDVWQQTICSEEYDEVFGMDMIMEKDYDKLKSIMHSIYNTMTDIGERKGNRETVTRVNEKLIELKTEALKIVERLENGEDDLRVAFIHGDYRSLENYYLPCYIALRYLNTYFHYDKETKVYRVDRLHEAIANGEYDFIFDWDEEKAYEVTWGDTTYISQKYHDSTLINYPEKERYYAARLNGFHEYLHNRMKSFIGKLTRLESSKKINPIGEPSADLLNFTIDYVNKNFLKTFNEENEYEYKGRVLKENK